MRRSKHPKGPRPDGDDFRNKVMGFIDGFWRENYFSPSIREISIGTKANSTSHVLYTLSQLDELGLIHKTSRLSRCYVPARIIKVIQGE